MELVHGRQEFLLIVNPFSTHLRCAERAGLEIASLKKDDGTAGLDKELLCRPGSSDEHHRTRGAVVILKKS